MSTGGTARRDAVGELIASDGGKSESFYFAFGDADVYVIAGCRAMRQRPRSR